MCCGGGGCALGYCPVIGFGSQSAGLDQPVSEQCVTLARLFKKKKKKTLLPWLLSKSTPPPSVPPSAEHSERCRGGFRPGLAGPSAPGHNLEGSCCRLTSWYGYHRPFTHTFKDTIWDAGLQPYALPVWSMCSAVSHIGILAGKILIGLFIWFCHTDSFISAFYFYSLSQVEYVSSYFLIWKDKEPDVS